MKNFISNCISQILNSTTNISDAIFVLPSKRASIFLRKEIAQQVKQTIFLPKIISIEEFIEEVSALKTINNLETLFAFYKVYETIIPQKLKEPFDSFTKWAQVLLHDFNEIDRYKIDAVDFFNNLSNIKQIENWDLNGEPTELIKNYLDFWKNSHQYYQQLKITLLEDNIGYQGLVYREASEQIEHYIQNNDQHHYFLGFNALNQCEEDIFQELLQQECATVFWDTDKIFYTNKTHTASHFLRKYKTDWNYYHNNPLTIVSNQFVEEKEINITALPKNSSQAKKVGELLSHLSAKELTETAVILGDETLLLPVLNSLPKNVKDINITMGLALQQVPLTSFFESIFQLYIKQSGSRFYYKRLLQFLNNNYAKIVLGVDEVKKITKYIYENNTISLTKNEICSILPNSSLLLQILSLKQSSVSDCLIVFNAVILKLKENLSENKDLHLLDLEYLYRFNEVFNKLGVLQEKHQVLKDISGLFQIYKEIITTETLDFKGEPVKGLQIMGMLETRALDFKRIIMTSVNEGILPSGKSNNSFIPFDLKIAFNLPTYFDKDAVYAYHFFRLMQRVQNVDLLYNTESDGLNVGEKSRFLLQLEALIQKKHKLTYNTNAPAIPSTSKMLRSIDKDDAVITRLQEIAGIQKGVDKRGNNYEKGGFSPSALTQYMRNPIDFYTQKILRIYEEDEVEETVAANTLGTIVHNTLEDFYKPYEGEILSVDAIKKMQQQIDAKVKEQFEQVYKMGDVSKGKNLIIYNVAKRYVSNFLREEINLIDKSKEVIIHQIEADLRIEIPMNNLPFPVYIAGKVDRIDEVDGVIRIIDYKTGAVSSSQVQVSDWDLITTDYKKYSKPFQILAYAYMAKQNGVLPNKPIEAGIISFKNLKAGFIKFGKKEHEGRVTKNNPIDPEITDDVLEDYIAQVKALITEICDVNIPFTEKEV